MKTRILTLLTFVSLIFFATSAFATSLTVATFQDPSGSASNALFTFTQGSGTTANPVGSIVSGGWSTMGSNLLFAPTNTTFNNTTFSFGPFTVTSANFNGLNFGPGSFTFGQGSTSLLTYNFDQASLTNTNVGSTNLNAQIVSITGLGPLAGYTFSSPQSFAFGLTNGVGGISCVLAGSCASSTWTAAFTSSATVNQVPGPSTLLLLGTGLIGLGMWGRRVEKSKTS
jgi:hypothetical protein